MNQHDHRNYYYDRKDPWPHSQFEEQDKPIDYAILLACLTVLTWWLL